MGVHRDKRSYVSRWDHCTIVSGVERSSFRVITRSRDIKALVCHSLSETKLLISGEFQDDKPKSVRNKVVQK